MGKREVETDKRKGARRVRPGVVAISVIGGVLVALVAAYCILCAAVRAGDTLFDGTTVNGIDIGGMSRDEAISAVTESLAGVGRVGDVDYSELDLVVEGVGTYTVDLTASMGYDPTGVVDEALEHDRGGSFWTLGRRRIEARNGGGESYTILPHAVDRDAIADALEETGILELDTVIQTTWTRNDEALFFVKGQTGVCVDEEALISQITEQTAKENYDPLICPTVAITPEEIDLQAIYDGIYCAATEAELIVAEDNSYTITESSRGLSFDLAAAEQELADAEEGSVVRIDLIWEEPSIDTETLQECLFRDLLGEYTTTVSGTSARRSNVRLAAEKFDGTILLSGEVFSYNDTVGQRTEEAGFQEASAYLNGETVDELGGGVCQGSSTLYCAALYANLEIVERRCHTYVSSYVPLGMDATVSWGGPDFQFRNDTDFPIQIVAIYEDDKLTCQIYGTKVSDFRVEITTETLEVIEPTEEEVPDDNMDEGTSVVEDSGHTGYRVQSYRLVYDGEGNLQSETEEARSTYSAQPKIIRVGTRVPEPEEEEGPEEEPEEEINPEEPIYVITPVLPVEG